MKKIFYIFTIAFLALILVGCRKDKTETPTPTPTPEVVTPTPTPEPVYLFTTFTGSETKKLIDLFGETIPFISNNLYYFEEENGTIHYQIVGRDGSALEEYNEKLLSIGYTYTAWSITEGHTYSKGDIVLNCNFVSIGNENYINIYIFVEETLTQGGTEDVPTVDNPTEGTNEPTVDNPTQGTDEPAESSIQKVLDAAAGLADKATLENQTATGTVKSIDYPYNSQYGDITITISDEVAEIYCYQVKGDCAATLKVGDVVTVTGQVMNYSGTIEFYKATITLVSNSNTPDEPTEDEPQESSIQKILDEAANLSLGGKLSGNRTATGYVKEITEAYTSTYKTISFILSDDVAEILVHRTKSSCASTLKVGDFVSVTGTIYLYDDKANGVLEFQYPEVTLTSSSSNQGGSSSSGGTSGGTSSTTHRYTDFTSSEKSLFNQVIGFVIPFIANDDYKVEEYTYESEVGINFYTFDNTQAEFNAYLSKITNAGFLEDGTQEDEYGDTWYFYSKGTTYLDVAYYETEEGYVIDLYVYYEDSGANTGGSGSGSGTTDVDLITNDGKGLPTGTNGVYNVNFNDATYVKNVHDQGYYIDGCPTTGDVKVLVIPVEFTDRTASSLGYNLSKLEAAFNGETGSTDYYSVAEYFNISSYGQLDLEFVILDSWFRPANDSTYYLNQTMDYSGSEIAIGDQIIMDEALAYLEDIMDLNEFDSDGNNIIDAVILINTLEIDSDGHDMEWAYRYWNLYTDNEGYYYEYDGVSANDYLWASYQFLLESHEETGVYNENNMNTYTYIHEFSHVLGADDYYDTAYVEHPLEGLDMMDAMLGDHNPYTKFNYGWITTSRLVVAEDTVTLTLEEFSKNGDTIIIADNWDSTLGAYQEYYVLMYYKGTGLNGGEYGGYFMNDGIVVYHINASLYSEVYEDETYYDVYNNNTDSSDQYGTADNLIELVQSNSDTYIHGVNTECNGSLPYIFTVDSITTESATITFSKN